MNPPRNGEGPPPSAFEPCEIVASSGVIVTARRVRVIVSTPPSIEARVDRVLEAHRAGETWTFRELETRLRAWTREAFFVRTKHVSTRWSGRKKYYWWVRVRLQWRGKGWGSIEPLGEFLGSIEDREAST